ncbi:MAG: RNA polymerase subunit sigma [Planctomycetaceae bacterium]
MRTDTPPHRVASNPGDRLMSGPIVRTGTTPEFGEGWDRIFGGEGRSSGKNAGARKTAKKSAKTKAAATKSAKKAGTKAGAAKKPKKRK